MHHGIGKVPLMDTLIWDSGDTYPLLLVTSGGDGPKERHLVLSAETEIRTDSKQAVCILLECCLVHTFIHVVVIITHRSCRA